MKWRNMCGMLVLAGLLLLPLQANALSVSAGFTQQAQYGITPQIFPIGDVIDVSALEEGQNWDFEQIPPIMYVQVNGVSPSDETEVVLKIYLEVSGRGRLIELVTDPFEIGEWAENVPGGRLYNDQWENLIWMRIDGQQSNTASPADFADLIDGLNMAASVYTLGIEVHEGSVAGPILPGGMYTTSIQVFNPSQPIPLSPTMFDDVPTVPITFNWSWTGGPVNSNDVMLYIVQFMPGQEDMDPLDVILQRSPDPTQTKFAGHPQMYDMHTFTGAGMGESPLIEGNNYAWMVEVRAATVMPGGYRVFRSTPGVFHFGPQEGGGGGGGVGEPGMSAQMSQLLDILSSKLTPDQYAVIVSQLQGYTPAGVTFGGISGRSMGELTNLLMQPGLEVENVIVSD